MRVDRKQVRTFGKSAFYAIFFWRTVAVFNHLSHQESAKRLNKDYNVGGIYDTKRETRIVPATLS